MTHSIGSHLTCLFDTEKTTYFLKQNLILFMISRCQELGVCSAAAHMGGLAAPAHSTEKGC